MERFNFVFLVAGLCFFALAFVVSGMIPMLAVKDLDVRTVEQMAQKPPFEFTLLAEQYPEAYAKAFPDLSETEAFAEATTCMDFEPAGRRMLKGFAEPEAVWSIVSA